MVKQINKLPPASETGTDASFAEKAMPIKPGNLMVLTGPSGVGKGTLTKRLLAEVPRLVKSVSVTTRERRPKEEEGVDYFFRSREEFETLKPDLLEWAEFAGNCYGTPLFWVDEQLDKGNDVLLEIEVQGAHQVRKKRAESLLIFVSPPSFDELRCRLESRGTETEEKIMRRLAKAEDELREKHLFHYEVINDDIDVAVNNLTHIVYAERCRIRKQVGGNSSQ